MVIKHAERAHRRVALAASAAALILGATACSDDGSDLPPPPSPVDEPAGSPTLAPTFDARTIEAWQELQARFDELMETWIRWAAEGSPGGFVDPSTVELGRYVVDLFLSDVTVELADHARNGQVRDGRPVWRDAQLLDLDWDRMAQFEGEEVNRPLATFDVCVDDSDWVVVDADTGEPATGEPGGAHVWTVQASLGEQRDEQGLPTEEDEWRFFERDTHDRSRPC